MIKISYCRCDDRLIHGQVIFKWLRFLNFNKILVIDDAAAIDVIEQGLIKMSVPTDSELKILSVDEAKRYFYNITSDDTLVLIRNMETIDKMLKDFQIETLNLGRIPTGTGKKKITNNIYLNEYDLSVIKSCLNNDTNIVIQLVPDENVYLVNENLEEIERMCLFR